MKHIEGKSRVRLTMLPDAVEDYIAEENPVRFLDVSVDNLDLKDLGFQRVETEECGRPPYHPGGLLKLFLYGYLNRIRSSRLLEREARRNPELLWLLKRLAPDLKTIAVFRKDNGRAIRRVCNEFTLFCRECNLFGGELDAIDGSKFKASNARDRNFSQCKAKERSKETEEKIRRYLEELEENDKREQGIRKPTAKELLEIIAHLKKRKKEWKRLTRRMEQTGQKQVSLTAPDCRSMSVGKGHGTEVGYNVQVSVDDKHKLIVDHEVTNDVTDQGHLSQMAVRSKKVLGLNEFDVLADMGYFDGQDLAACWKEGIQPWISRPNTSINRKKGLFAKEDFRYRKRSDGYFCPAGKRMDFRFQTRELGRDVRYYATPACGSSRLRPKCTRNAGGRRITRLAEEWALEEMERRNRLHPEKLRRRCEIVEQPFPLRGLTRHDEAQNESRIFPDEGIGEGKGGDEFDRAGRQYKASGEYPGCKEDGPARPGGSGRGRWPEPSLLFVFDSTT
jgi:transposase